MIIDSKKAQSEKRRERERQRKLTEVLEAAGRVFSRKGFYAASMEEIAVEAGYATGALYRYFNSKESLYIALLEQRMGERLAAVQERAAQAQGHEKALRAVVQVQVEKAAEDTSLLQIFFQEKLENASQSTAWRDVEMRHLEFLDWLAKGIRMGQKEGIFREGAPMRYVLALQGMLVSLFRAWVMGLEDPKDHAKQSEFIADLAVRAICIHPTLTHE